MTVTGIITVIVLAFKYVSVPAELGLVNPVLRADFLCISVRQAPWASGRLWVPEPLNWLAKAPVLKRHPLDWGISGDPGPGSHTTHARVCTHTQSFIAAQIPQAGRASPRGGRKEYGARWT